MPEGWESVRTACESAGVALALHSDGERFLATPSALLTDELVAVLREHKPEIMAHLRGAAWLQRAALDLDAHRNACADCGAPASYLTVEGDWLCDLHSAMRIDALYPDIAASLPGLQETYARWEAEDATAAAARRLAVGA